MKTVTANRVIREEERTYVLARVEGETLLRKAHW